MGNLTGFSQGGAYPTSEGTTAPTHALGTILADRSGGVWIYLQAGESFVKGEWVVYDASFVASQLGAASRGPCGIADGTVTSDDYFWAQIEGVNTTAVGTSAVTSAGQLVAGASSDGGYVSEGTSAAGAVVYGAISRSACSTATSPITAGLGLFTVQLFRPYVNGLLTEGSS